MNRQITEADLAQKQVGLRRLNRTEYANALRDLLGVTLNLEGRLPDDRVARSFDTIGASLTISDAQIERYHDVARDAVTAFLDQANPVTRLDIRKPARQLVQRQMVEVHDVLLGVGEDGVVTFSSGKPRTFLQEA